MCDMWFLLLSHFSRIRLGVTPSTAAHQAPPSLGFSRQEHWSGLPVPSPMWFLRLGHKKDTLSAWHSPLECLPLELILYVVSESRPHVDVTGYVTTMKKVADSQHLSSNVSVETLYGSSPCESLSWESRHMDQRHIILVVSYMNFWS